MNDTYRLSPLPVGARTLALKQAYPGNLMWGIALASMVHLAIMATLLGFDVFDNRPITAAPGQGGDVIIEGEVVLKPPPSMTTKPSAPSSIPSITIPATPSIGVFTAVPDEQVAEEPVFATRHDLALLNAGQSGTWGQGGGNGEASGGFFGGSSLLENTDEPVPLHLVQELPIPISGDPPLYPEHAALLGKSATVTVRARIDATGKVIEAKIYNSTDNNSGFNESALAAAYTRTYRPAIQNGRPVSVWIVYRVEFKRDD